MRRDLSSNRKNQRNRETLGSVTSTSHKGVISIAATLSDRITRRYVKLIVQRVETHLAHAIFRLLLQSLQMCITVS
jgi:hypothetical protein